MAAISHSELTARLAIEGVVATLAGTVKGQLPVKPRVLGQNERAELGIAPEGDFLFYPLGDSGVFFYTHLAFTTIWYVGADSNAGLAALEGWVRRLFPQGKVTADGPHKTNSNFKTRSYDINLGAGRLAIVEAIYPAPGCTDPKFSVRVTSMGIKN